jgi:hypothetical protein
MMRAWAIALAAAGLLLTAGILPNSARAQQSEPPRPAAEGIANPIGKVMTATGAITIEHVNAVVVQANLGPVGQAKVGDLVYMGDVVQTGPDGKVGITFTDGTAFNLSNNARMVLNEFVYDPNGKANSTLFSLTKGTFTFVAGKVAKTGDMKIDTPVATMGIRGTTPHVEISDDGTVAFTTLIEGNKDKAAPQKSGPTPKQRQAKRAPAQTTPAAKPVESEADKNMSVKLKICKTC